MFEEILKIVREQMHAAEDAVAADTDIVEELGADSLDVVEIVVKIEERFGIEIPDADIEKGHTPRQICDYLRSRGV